MKKLILISFAVIFAALITNNSIKSYPCYGNVYVHPITGHKVGLLGDCHKKFNDGYEEIIFLNTFMPYLKYILSSEDLNLKFIVESSNGKDFSEDFYQKNEKLNYLDIYDKFNNKAGLGLITYLCFSDNRHIFRHLCNYFGLGNLNIKNEAIEADQRKGFIDDMSYLLAQLEDRNTLDNDNLKSYPDILIKWSKEVINYLLSDSNDLSIDVYSLIKFLNTMIKDFEHNESHTTNLNEKRIWQDLKSRFENNVLYINEIIKSYDQISYINKNLIKKTIEIDGTTPLHQIPYVMIFVIPRLLNNLNRISEQLFCNSIIMSVADAGFLKEICIQAKLNNNCLLMVGAAHCLNLEKWLTELGYIKIFNNLSLIECFNRQNIYSKFMKDLKEQHPAEFEKYPAYFFPYIGDEVFLNIMDELLGKEKAAELSTMKSDILKYHSSMIPLLKARDNLNNILGLLAGAGIGLAATFGLGKIIGFLKYS